MTTLSWHFASIGTKIDEKGNDIWDTKMNSLTKMNIKYFKPRRYITLSDLAYDLYKKIHNIRI